MSYTAILCWVHHHFAPPQTKGQCDIHLLGIARHLPATWTRLMKVGPHAPAAHFRVTGAAAREQERFLREIDCVSTPKPVRGRRRILWLVAFWHVFENPSQNITLQDVTRFLRRGARFNLHSANGSSTLCARLSERNPTESAKNSRSDKKSARFSQNVRVLPQSREDARGTACFEHLAESWSTLSWGVVVRLSSTLVKPFGQRFSTPSYFIYIFIGFNKLKISKKEVCKKYSPCLS